MPVMATTEICSNITNTPADSLSSLTDSLCDPNEITIPQETLSSQTTSQASTKSLVESIKNLFRTIGHGGVLGASNASATDAAETNKDEPISQAKSFEESESESSSDSEEETMRHMQQSIRRSQRSFHSSLSFPRQTATNGSTLPPPTLDVMYASSVTSSLTTTSLKNAEQANMPLSDSPASELNSGPGWYINDTESHHSNDERTLFEQNNEVAAAIAVKPTMSSDDNCDDDDEDDIPLPRSIEPISACGTVDIALQYSVSERKLQLTVIEANELPSKDRGGASIIQVRLVVLPAKRKRYKTKVQHINSPRFAESFKLSHISPEDLKGLGIRLRLYGIGKVKDRLIGEATVRFDELNLIKDPQLTVTLQLEPRTDVNRGDPESNPSQNENDMSSISTLTHGGSLPELLLSLSYNEMTGRLCVEVVKGSHFRNLAMTKPPDTFVKIVLLNSSCQEMAQSKTSIRRSQPNPVFKETFYFQVALFQLAEVSLMVSVHCTRTMKSKYMIGWISLGQNSSSESDEQHWLEMREAKGKVVSRWHTLIES